MYKTHPARIRYGWFILAFFSTPRALIISSIRSNSNNYEFRSLIVLYILSFISLLTFCSIIFLLASVAVQASSSFKLERIRYPLVTQSFATSRICTTWSISHSHSHVSAKFGIPARTLTHRRSRFAFFFS